MTYLQSENYNLNKTYNLNHTVLVKSDSDTIKVVHPQNTFSDESYRFLFSTHVTRKQL